MSLFTKFKNTGMITVLSYPPSQSFYVKPLEEHEDYVRLRQTLNVFDFGEIPPKLEERRRTSADVAKGKPQASRRITPTNMPKLSQREFRHGLPREISYSEISGT